jgi:AmiR/NasT family two-component response regulator
MVKPLDPKQVVTTQELAISNMLEIEALAGSSPNLSSSLLISITH